MYKRKNRSVRQYFINIMENSLFAEFEEKIKKVYIIISIFLTINYTVDVIMILSKHIKDAVVCSHNRNMSMPYLFWSKRERYSLCKKNKKATDKISKQNTPLAEQKKEQIPKHNIKKLITLFSTTLYISAFTFGGGFVIVTFMKRKFVDQLKWINEKEMLDFTALAQSSPGAIAVNAAILVGWKICGFAGMLVAVLGTIQPPMIILSVISFFYAVFVNNIWVAVVLKGMQAAVAAVILDAACDLGINAAKEKSILSGIIFIAAFVCDFIFQLNVIYIILAAVVLGIIKTFILRYREMKS